MSKADAAILGLGQLAARTGDAWEPESDSDPCAVGQLKNGTGIGLSEKSSLDSVALREKLKNLGINPSKQIEDVSGSTQAEFQRQ